MGHGKAYFNKYTLGCNNSVAGIDFLIDLENICIVSRG